MKRPLVYLILSVLISTTACKPKFDETTPKMAPITEAVFASGSIEPKDAYTLTALFDGFILKSFVTENDLVKDGQMLFQLDNRQQNTQVNIAKTNVEYAKVNAATNSPALLQINAQIVAARVKMQTDSVTLTRFEHLLATNSVSSQERDNARMNYQSSLSNYNALLENYKATSNKVHLDFNVSQSQLQNAQAGNQYYNLQATGPSKVYQIFKKQGDLVRKGDQVAQLGNPDSIVINLDIDEGSISKIKLDQQVLIELNTEKNKTYEARITKIYPHFNETSQSYKVEARFLKEMPGLISGSQLQANIITNKKNSVILIPHAYVMGGNKVLVQKEKKIDTVVITTGIISDEWIEVMTGLTTNDKIVKQK
jgi:multidrug efflux pump subunit AcrA (membrane-fusion protein)